MDPNNSRSNQPIHTERWAIVFNGEIYNFRTLRDELKAAHGRTFVTNSDTEVLLAAIDSWGVSSTLARISGIFAFAAFDKVNQTLFLARDRLGIKPLFYYVAPDRLWFASAPAAIARACGKQWRLDYEALHKFFSLGAPCSAETLFSGIVRLGPAEVMEVDGQGRRKISRYWNPTYRKDDLEGALEHAIVSQQEAHVRSALFLSGGVDSTVMSVYLRDMDFFHLDSPERKYAEYAAEFMQGNLCIRGYTNTDDFDDFNRIYVESCGEPSASAPIPLLVSQAIQGAGYKVAFSANGADELFFGYPRTPAPELFPSHVPANNYEMGPVSEFAAQELHIFRDPKSFNIPKFAKGSELARESWLAPLLHPLQGDFPASAERRWYELQTYVQYDLNPTLDFSSMACSLEVRVPFLDHELIEVALSHDANEMITCDFGRKTPLKRVLKRHGLHPLLWARPKIGFSVPESVREVRQNELERALKQLSDDGFLKLSPLCRPNSRDHQYLSAAAHAFLHWKRVWIDSGVVSA